MLLTAPDLCCVVTSSGAKTCFLENLACAKGHYSLEGYTECAGKLVVNNKDQVDQVHAHSISSKVCVRFELP